MNSHVLKSSHAVALPKEGNVPDWIQVFPSGTFSGRDGRGPYVCEPDAVIARTREHNGSLDIPVDYDHQLEFSAVNGRPAPAAGWITELTAREDGIWGRVEWTEKGRAHVAAREYRYVSPVYYYEESTGEILAIESVALTNIPNLTGLKALASRESGPNPSTGDTTMSFLKTVASVLGVTDAEPTEAVVEAAARRVVAESGAMKAAMSVMAEAAKADDKTPDGIVKAVQSVAARAERPDVSRYVPVETFNAVNVELGRIKAAQSVALVERGKADGKISPAMEPWAKEAAARDPEAFKSFLAAAPDLRPGAGKAAQSAKSTPPGTGGDLDGPAKALCRAMGVSEEAYKKAMHRVKGGDDDGSDE